MIHGRSSIGGHQTQRDPVVQQQQPSMIMPNLVEPMAANDTGFGSPFNLITT